MCVPGWWNVFVVLHAQNTNSEDKVDQHLSTGVLFMIGKGFLTKK